MRTRWIAPLIGSAALGAVLLGPVAISAQTSAASSTAAAGSWDTPRTPWGDPDLQGTWDISTTTPLERPRELGERGFFTEEEARTRDHAIITGPDQRKATPQEDFEPYNAFWWDRGQNLTDLRAALVVDPPDGRLPPMTPEGQTRQKARSPLGTDSPADRSLYDRCIIRSGLPRLPAGYNNNFEIVQAPGYVGILIEQIHEVRIIPLDGRPHLVPTVRQWKGDARGRWEGDTLVVETTNFTDQTHLTYGGAFHSEGMRAVERFRRVDADTIAYDFTITDERTWTRPWTAAFPWKQNDGHLYEYACHEGNYSMVNMLSGARAEEKAARETAARAQSR